jgi:hypothetical protein
MSAGREIVIYECKCGHRSLRDRTHYCTLAPYGQKAEVPTPGRTYVPLVEPQADDFRETVDVLTVAADRLKARALSDSGEQ